MEPKGSRELSAPTLGLRATLCWALCLPPAELVWSLLALSAVAPTGPGPGADHRNWREKNGGLAYKLLSLLSEALQQPVAYLHCS